MSRFTSLVSQADQWWGDRIVVAWDWGSLRTRVLRLGTDQMVWSQPTRLVVHQGERELISIGENAARLEQGQPPPGMAVLLPIQQGVIADLEPATWYAQAVVNELQRQRPITRSPKQWWTRLAAVCAVPAFISPVERDHFRQVLQQAGWQQVELITKAQALAAYVKHTVRAQHLLVIDVGDQVTELVLIYQGQPLWSDTIGWGSQRLSEMIMWGVRQHTQSIISAEVAEKIKTTIASAKPNPKSPKRMVVRGKQIVAALPETIAVEQTFFNDLISQEIQEMLVELKDRLSQAPAEAVAQALEIGVMTLGGGGNLEKLEEVVAEALQTTVIAPPTTRDEAIVRGIRAAYQ